MILGKYPRTKEHDNHISEAKKLYYSDPLNIIKHKESRKGIKNYEYDDYNKEVIKRKGVLYYRFECIDCGKYHYTQKIKEKPRNPRCESCAAIKRSTGRLVTEKTRQKISDSLMGHIGSRYWLGKHFTQEHILKHALAMRGKPSKRKGTHCSEITKQKNSIRSKEMWDSKDFRQNYSKQRKGMLAGEKHPLWGKHHSDATRKKISLAKKGKPHPIHLSEEQLSGYSDRLYSYMKTHTLSNYNKSEQKLNSILQNIFPNQYKYNGTNQLKFKIASHAPDFVNVNGQKKLIEFNGCKWHCCPKCGIVKHPFNVPYEKVRAKDLRDIQNANKLGFQVLTIWSHDFKNMDTIPQILAEFHNKKAGIVNV